MKRKRRARPVHNLRKRQTAKRRETMPATAETDQHSLANLEVISVMLPPIGAPIGGADAPSRGLQAHGPSDASLLVDVEAKLAQLSIPIVAEREAFFNPYGGSLVFERRFGQGTMFNQSYGVLVRFERHVWIGHGDANRRRAVTFVDFSCGLAPRSKLGPDLRARIGILMDRFVSAVSQARGASR